MTNEALQLVLDSARRDVERVEKELAHSARRLEADMRTLLERLDEDRAVNGLGEVQGRGFDVDRLCALRQAKLEEVQRLEWLAAQV